ncbi:MAG: serine/threonine protein phosphatase 1 [Verrucomicrobiales bacterium]
MIILSEDEPSKRVLAIGDIHGCLNALETLAERIPLRPESDFLITLGDYVDRGPDSKGVLDWLRSWPGEKVNLRGNHEIMMLEAASGGTWAGGWEHVGGRETLASYGVGATLKDVPEAHWDFIGTLAPWFEIDSHFFVHANADPSLDLADQFETELFWERYDNPPAHKNGKIMVCGHAAQRSGLPRFNGNAICIDTWAYGEGWLTCLDVARQTYWQANQAGEFRTGALELDR